MSGVRLRFRQLIDDCFHLGNQLSDFIDLRLLVDQGLVQLVDIVLEMRQQSLHLGQAA